MMSRSFGPAGSVEKDGKIRLSCVTNKTLCFQYASRKCCDWSPARDIDDPATTPAWCKYADDTREEIATWRDFERFGLVDMTRLELLQIMRGIPDKYRNHYQGKPIGLNSHNAMMMRYAIRRWMLEKETV